MALVLAQPDNSDSGAPKPSPSRVNTNLLASMAAAGEVPFAAKAAEKYTGVTHDNDTMDQIQKYSKSWARVLADESVRKGHDKAYIMYETFNGAEDAALAAAIYLARHPQGNVGSTRDPSAGALMNLPDTSSDDDASDNDALVGYSNHTSGTPSYSTRALWQGVPPLQAGYDPSPRPWFDPNVRQGGYDPYSQPGGYPVYPQQGYSQSYYDAYNQLLVQQLQQQQRWIERIERADEEKEEKKEKRKKKRRRSRRS